MPTALYTVHSLIYPVRDIILAGINIQAIYSCNYPVRDIRLAGINIQAIYSCNYPVRDIRLVEIIMIISLSPVGMTDY